MNDWKKITNISVFKEIIINLFPGFFVSALIAIAAQFISDHYGAPAMLMALLFGIALNFLSKETYCNSGTSFSATVVLRFGIILLGMKISWHMAVQLGFTAIIVILGLVIFTIMFGIFAARLCGHGFKFGFLSSGAVAICGASAAMAISTILPRDARTEERLIFTIVGVTLLSTLAMIFYPILVEVLRLDNRLAGIFIGTTIHDVAQVVGAGFSISEETGEIATLVKLIRVSLLAPVIIIASLTIQLKISKISENKVKPTILPVFVIAFVVMVFINSLDIVPSFIQTLSEKVSRWSLLIAIGAVGLKTSLQDVLNVGGSAIILLFFQTIFIGILALVILIYFPIFD